MKYFVKKAVLVLLACALSLPAQAAFAAGQPVPTITEPSANERLPISPGETVAVENGDGTFTHFVLDPTAPQQPELEINPEWWRTVYDAAKRETERILPGAYAERTEDIILLLHSRHMFVQDIDQKKFRLSDGGLVAARNLSKKQALALATEMFPKIDDNRTGFVQGWFHWGRNTEFDIMALNYLDAGETTIHELAHAFTGYDTSDAEREAIAKGVAKSLLGNSDFVVLLYDGSPTLATIPESAPTLVNFEDFAGTAATPATGAGN